MCYMPLPSLLSHWNTGCDEISKAPSGSENDVDRAVPIMDLPESEAEMPISLGGSILSQPLERVESIVSHMDAT
jgi:hypothetical protein